MAKTKLVIDGSKPLLNGDYRVVLQITSKGKQLRITTNETVSKDNWIKESGLVKSGRKGDPLALMKNTRLTRLKNECDQKILNNIDKVAKMDVYLLKKFLIEEKDPIDAEFFRFIDKRITEVSAQGRQSTAQLLKAVRSKVLEFWVIPPLDMNVITVRWLEEFETYCKKPVKENEKRTQMTTNGVAVYMRYLRILMNDAIDENLIENYPFRKYRIKMVPTAHRNLAIEDVRKIRDAEFVDPPTYKKPDKSVKKADIPPRPLSKKRLDDARSIWLLSLYLSGISPKDLFYLKKTDVVDGRIVFNRFKTGTLYTIKIEPEAQEIIDRYKGEKFLLRFADYSVGERTEEWKKHARKSVKQWKDETQFGKYINKGLKQIQADLKIKTTNLTCYSARHSVASILRSKDVDVSIDDIALVLGHKRPDMKVTSIYTAEDFIHADKAMRKLLDALIKTPEEKKDAAAAVSPKNDE